MKHYTTNWSTCINLYFTWFSAIPIWNSGQTPLLQWLHQQRVDFVLQLWQREIHSIFGWWFVFTLHLWIAFCFSVGIFLFLKPRWKNHQQPPYLLHHQFWFYKRGDVCVVSRLEARSEEGAVHLLEEEWQEGSEGSTAGRFSGRDVCLPSWRGMVNSVSSRHETHFIESHHY